MDEPSSRLLELALRHRGRVVGALVGLLAAWLILRFGVLKAAFILAFGALGYLVGAEVDRRGSLGRAVRRFWRAGDR
ncbi:DUF2273 domain-containing protein [Limnochorda pilosa]|uniref:Small integral membrane protein n=1 Tax=Limnochorda pilosa TaxID=1555112 RepID=A0A0K2SMT8_LIMPI|nr:DUF2273 domain-containing protein [Limnochorda pilosa]BAS28425.1 hypothetical protein LIP_2595 [Limnochorda pilosa]